MCAGYVQIGILFPYNLSTMHILLSIEPFVKVSGLLCK
jgi:hypothetical protein